MSQNRPTLVSTRLILPLEKATGTRLEVMEITPKKLEPWKAPPFQRPLKANAKVLALAEQIKHDEVLPGIITIGVVAGQGVYVLDGQHRLHAFKLSHVESVYADVRIQHFDTLAEAGKEFVNLNSSLVRLTPDDVLRGLESSSEGLTLLRQRCQFIGYDQVRRGPNGPVVSMSMVLRSWNGSEPEVPTAGRVSAYDAATTLQPDDAALLADTLNLFMATWGRDREYWKLWSALNITLCMWLYRRMVLGKHSAKSTQLTKDAFKKAMMCLSAETDYLDWLVGRNMTDRDRSPAYSRIRSAIAKRFADDGVKVYLPAPAWAHSGGTSIRK